VILIDVLLGILTAAAATLAWRLLSGPADADRVIALDLAFVVFVSGTALLSVRLNAPFALILVLAATLVGFLATVALAHLLERRPP
jgi:multicomponent Na+:H+ antiporter subunit F